MMTYFTSEPLVNAAWFIVLVVEIFAKRLFRCSQLVTTSGREQDGATVETEHDKRERQVWK